MTTVESKNEQPPKEQENELAKYFNALPPKHKDIVSTHLHLAGELNMWYNIREFLIDQFHLNKFIMKKTKFYAQDPVAKQAYSRLFLRRKTMSSFDPFPCTVQSLLENVMYTEIFNSNSSSKPEDRALIGVYYSHRCKPSELKFDQFNPSEWTLNKTSTVTEDDRHVLQKFAVGILDFMDRAMGLVAVLGKSAVADVAKEHKRMAKYLIF